MIRSIRFLGLMITVHLTGCIAVIPAIIYGAGMGAAQRVAGQAENFLGGGLSGTAGHGQDFGVAAGPRCAAQVFQPALGVANGQQGPRHAVGRVGDQRRTGTGMGE